MNLKNYLKRREKPSIFSGTPFIQDKFKVKDTTSDKKSEKKLICSNLLIFSSIFLNLSNLVNILNISEHLGVSRVSAKTGNSLNGIVLELIFMWSFLCSRLSQKIMEEIFKYVVCFIVGCGNFYEFLWLFRILSFFMRFIFEWIY